MNKIHRIDATDFAFVGKSDNPYSSYDGFKIVTDTQTIKIGVSNSERCCERWGFIASEDDFSDFIGAEIFAITRVDRELNSRIYDFLKNERLEWGYSEGEAMFVNLATTKGLLQLVVYNYHSGNYGHEAVIISHELNKSITI